MRPVDERTKGVSTFPCGRCERPRFVVAAIEERTKNVSVLISFAVT